MLGERELLSLMGKMGTLRHQDKVARPPRTSLHEGEDAARDRASALARANVLLERALDELAKEPALEPFLGSLLESLVRGLRARAATLWLNSQAGEPRVFLTYEDGTVVQPERSSVYRLPDRHVVYFPITIASKRLGALDAHFTRPPQLLPEDVELGRALAAHAALAIQLSALGRGGREAAVVEERSRIARDIHDTVAQGIAGVILNLGSALESLEPDPKTARAFIARADSSARQALKDAREMVRTLRPADREDAELAAALASSIRGLRETTTCAIKLAVTGRPISLPRVVQGELLRVAEEALRNAIRHARTAEVRAEIAFDGHGVALCIKDRGRGFDVHAMVSTGYGLAGMRERVRRIGGRLDIRSVQGRGTEVRVKWRGDGRATSNQR